MSDFFEGRASDSPYVEAIWRGRAGSNYAPICPASGYWNLLFMKYDEKVRAFIVGPLTRAAPRSQPEGIEWFGITFSPGAFLPAVPVGKFLDQETVLYPATKSFFELVGSRWHFPDYDNAEIFIEKLVREELLVSDPMIKEVLQGIPQDVSLRTVRRRFLQATGLTYKTHTQIERAKQAVALLGQGVSLLDVAYQVGYADQSHMNRAIKHFIGYTPAWIARGGNQDLS